MRIDVALSLRASPRLRDGAVGEGEARQAGRAGGREGRASALCMRSSLVWQLGRPLLSPARGGEALSCSRDRLPS